MDEKVKRARARTLEVETKLRQKGEETHKGGGGLDGEIHKCQYFRHRQKIPHTN